MNILPVARAHTLRDQVKEQRWLIEGLWAEQAVGIIGGEPKCCKSFLALTLAIAVASGKPCLGRFAVPSRGSVLLFPAEDPLPIVKRRLTDICKAHRLCLQELPIYIITTPVLRLDIQTDRDRLRETVKKIRPALLILDPFVRLHSIDENASGEVAKILHHLRQIQRSCHCAVALVHHAKKGAAKHRAGQALRGSSEFHAWGDSNLYLRRNGAELLSLVIEHRAESSPDPLPLILDTNNDTPHLAINHYLNSEPTVKQTLSTENLIIQALKNSTKPMRCTELRATLPLRNATVSKILAQLEKQGILSKVDGRYALDS